MRENKYNLITILGPTASGKTGIAARLALALDGEVISADSRQVYRGMDIGTGKDYADYEIDGQVVPSHLIDIADAGYEYNVFEFQRDFFDVFADISARGKVPIMCGGSGLYLESVLKNYKLVRVPINDELRLSLQGKSLDELTSILKSYKNALHNQTDIVNEKRAIRAIEIEEYYSKQPDSSPEVPGIDSLVVGIKYDRMARRERITERLTQRLNQGMIDEVKRLLDSGLLPEQLIYYGLEYKFITQFLTNELSYRQMFDKLNVAIHQFAKRQMTWFRRMEKQGTEIHWINGNLSVDEKVSTIIDWYRAK